MFVSRTQRRSLSVRNFESYTLFYYITRNLKLVDLKLELTDWNWVTVQRVDLLTSITIDSE